MKKKFHLEESAALKLLSQLMIYLLNGGSFFWDWIIFSDRTRLFMIDAERNYNYQMKLALSWIIKTCMKKLTIESCKLAKYSEKVTFFEW